MTVVSLSRSISISLCPRILVSSTLHCLLATTSPARRHFCAGNRTCPPTISGGVHPCSRFSWPGRLAVQVVALHSGKLPLHTTPGLPRRTVIKNLSRTFSLKMSAGIEKMVAVRDTVELTEMEGRIFAILTATLQHFRLQTQLRVAGGWVRDKLIGRNSTDIDIAIDDMLGRVFCEKVNEYLQTIGEETHSVGVILSNPDQSKHLETANMRVLGVSIDFVNLRAETYTEASRIPTMEFGTPEEDAYRRDLTINSLFYNINTGMVEDFTKQGIEDLKSGVIRTPLPPDVTFLDDPLRVCRAIRFGARFDFELVEDLRKAAASECVTTALENKVSRERIGHEIELMIKGNRPEKAMQYLDELLLLPAVFRVSKAVPDPPFPNNYGRLCVNALQAVTQVLTEFRYASELTNNERWLLLLGAFFLPLRAYTCFTDKKKKKKIPVSKYIILESLKLKGNDATGVEELHITALTFKPIIKQLLQTYLESPEDVKNMMHRGNSKVAAVAKHRVELGLLLTKSKNHWRGALLLATIMDLPALTPQEGVAFVGLLSDDQTLIRERVEACNAVEDIVIQLGLTKIWESKSLLDGHEIMAALNLGKDKRVQEWKDRVLQWQLAHPQGTSEECREWMLEENVKRLKSGCGNSGRSLIMGT